MKAIMQRLSFTVAAKGEEDNAFVRRKRDLRLFNLLR